MKIGVDIGGTNIAAGIVDDDGRIITKLKVKTNINLGYRYVLENIKDLLLELLKTPGITSVGIGCPGIIDNLKGLIVYSNNLNLRNINIRKDLSEYINLPILLENDANCAMIAEHMYGAAKNTKNAVLVTLGTGIGGGIIIDRKLYRGSQNCGGEFGHMIIQMDGECCSCESRGCFEAYASATALKRQTRLAFHKYPDSQLAEIIHKENKVSACTAFKAAALGDCAALEVVNNYIKYLSLGLINIINIFNPELIILGGGVCCEGDGLILPLKEALKNRQYGKNLSSQAQIETAKIKNDAGIIGAAILDNYA